MKATLVVGAFLATVFASPLFALAGLGIPAVPSAWSTIRA